MVLKYGTYPKKMRKNYIDADYLKSVEICCPEMSFHLWNKELYNFCDGDIAFSDDVWPLSLNTNHLKLALDLPIYHCPHCGKPVLVYVNDKLYTTSAQLEER